MWGMVSRNAKLRLKLVMFLQQQDITYLDIVSYEDGLRVEMREGRFDVCEFKDEWRNRPIRATGPGVMLMSEDFSQVIKIKPLEEFIAAPWVFYLSTLYSRDKNSPYYFPDEVLIQGKADARIDAKN